MPNRTAVEAGATTRSARLAQLARMAAEPNSGPGDDLGACADLLRATCATLWVTDPDRGLLIRQARHPRLHAPCTPVVVGDVDARPDIIVSTADDEPRFFMEDARASSLDVTIRCDGRFAAVLHFEDADATRDWDEADRLVALTIAQLTAASIERTNRVRTERTLHDVVRQVDETQAIAGVGSWQWDTLNNVITWSAEQLRIRGLDEASHPRTFDAFLACVHPEHREPIVKVCDDLLRTGEPFSIQYRIVRPDGTVRWLHARGRMIADRDGSNVRMVGTSQDITERLEAEAALRASEESYRTIFELAGDAIFVHDPETGAILDANRKACEMHGSTRDELKQEGVGAVSQVDAPFSAEDALERLRLAAAGVPQRFEWQSHHRSGESVWVEVSLERVMILGQPRVLAIVRNMTERKTAEEVMQRAYARMEQRVAERTAELEQAKDAAERANRAKSEFLSRMSHELRTPMNSILGFAQVLARADLPAQHARSVQHILRGGRHLLRLINEVLEIARIEAGLHQMSLEPVRIGAVFRDAIMMARPLAEQFGIRIEEDDVACRDRFAQADRQRLVQVLLNLLANAIKYNRPDGRVHLSCAVEPTDDGANRIALRVEDTGRGIPAERQESLFTPFARLGAEQTEIEGTGLGLALSLRLTEAMGGDLVLERSTPDGSVFRIELCLTSSPLAQAEETAGRDSRSDDEPHGPATILYVEDNLANLALIETVLQARPLWRTIPALQGQIGLELAREHSPDLILLDLHLPDLSGDDVLRRLQADERTAHIPVVVISADATHSTVERLLAHGVAAFLTKPLDIDEFMTTLERLLPAEAVGR